MKHIPVPLQTLFAFVLLLSGCFTHDVRAETIFQIEDYGVKIAFLVDGESEQKIYQLDLTGLGNSPESPTIKTLEEPRRLVFDIPTKKRIRTFEEEIAVLPEIEKIRLGGHQNSLRVVFELAETFRPSGKIDSSLKTDGTVKLTFGNKGKVAPVAAVSAPNNSDRDLTRAYTVDGDKITTREVRAETNFSKTPDNAKPLENPNSLPSLIREDIVNATDEETVSDKTPQQIKSVAAETEELDKVQTTPAKKLQKPLLETSDLSDAPLLDNLDVSKLPFIEEGREYNNFIELLGILLLITLIAVVTLRREELAALLFRNQKEPENNLRLESAPSSYTMPYIVLGCKETDSDEDIKARYRHLVKVFHGDRLQSQKLPQEVLELTDKEFQRVQQAYEQLKSMRGL